MKTTLQIRADPAFESADRAVALEIVRHARAGSVITIETGKLRSGAQNRFYWGVFLPAIADYMGEPPNDRMALERLHDYFATEHLFLEAATDEDGREYSLVRSTGGLTTVEFEAYLEKIRKFFAERFGVRLPEPNVLSNEILTRRVYAV